MPIYVPDQYVAQKICKRAVESVPFTLSFVPELHKTQNICEKAVLAESYSNEFVLDQYKIQAISNKLINKRHKKCVKESLQYVSMNCDMFLISIQPRRCVIELF